MSAKLIVIGGPTATGKSAAALALAQIYQAEIVNADSMQVYRGMDIGTAKLTLAERKGIIHHLIDVLDVNQEITVAWYQTQARKIIDNLLGKSINVVLVGGTGLYIKSVLDELDFPDSDEKVRKELEEKSEKIGALAMHQLLEKLDPAAAIAIPYQNLRRVIRALEVIEITGKPFTANLPREKNSRYPNAIQFAFEVKREELDILIEKRTRQIFDDGLVKEVEILVKKGLLEGKTARAAIGYQQVVQYLQNEISFEQARELTEIATRQYARRQFTWFKRDLRVNWIDSNSTDERIKIMRELING